MNSAELRATLVGWLEEVKHWYEPSHQDWSDYIESDQEFHESRPGQYPENWAERPEVQHLTLWTNDHVYYISFSEDYMGCIANSRKPRAGESWTRGNDLPDGKFSKATFDFIIKRIVGYELVARVKKVSPMVDGASQVLPMASEVPV